ncbi:hypothetical protein FRX31_006175 [Thalictrum thalictroides]|uniref:Uncharacterized protein n=1 Tax=Thalictrum thalictroides TaxID=46969 RepID=A0A7J6X3I7_THATH|nr:hypothetical protein FRX31_006175 [Thalictrum thalictroides]
MQCPIVHFIAIEPKRKVLIHSDIPAMAGSGWIEMNFVAASFKDKFLATYAGSALGRDNTVNDVCPMH